jgi:hypothetical protein
MTRNPVLLALALAAVVLVTGGVVVLLDVKHHPWKLYDEWECSRGEAPYFNKHGGEACAPEGSRLPAGARWDPLGNRPFDCTDRDGWVLIEGTNHYGSWQAVCHPAGRPIPHGWHLS